MKSMVKFRINNSEINALLLIIGFPIFTYIAYPVSQENAEFGTSSGSLLSILYRAFALIVSIICIYKNKYNFSNFRNNGFLKLYFIIVLLMIIKLLYCFYFAGDSSKWSIGVKRIYLMFAFGVQLLPSLAFALSFHNINWKKVLSLIALLLVILCTNTLLVTWGDSGRISLNSHQSTLSFGGYAALLSLSSISLYRMSNKKIGRIVFLICFLIGILSLLRAGSRGPLISCIFSLTVLFIVKVKNAKLIFCLLLVYLLFGDIIYNFLYEISPTIFDRMENTIYEGDTSGREGTFNVAWDIIINNPIFGYDPIFISGFGPHNLLLQFGMGLGLIGLLLGIVLYIYIIYKSLVSNKVDCIQFFFSSFALYFIMRTMTGVNIFFDADFSFAIISIILYKSRYEKPQSVVFRKYC